MAEPDSKKKLIIRISVLLLATIAYFYCPRLKDFVANTSTYLHHHDLENLRRFILSYGIWAPLTSIAIMILQSLVPFVPGLIITITNAWVFGWQYGALYSWLGALIGALIDFGIARWYGRPVAEKFVNVKYLTITDSFFNKYGVIAVLTTRLIPMIPFKVVSYGAGLTAISVWQFVIATGLGQTPPIILYSFLGQSLNRNSHIIVIVSLLLAAGIGLLTFYYRTFIKQYFSSKKE